MSGLKEKLGKKIEEWRPRTTRLIKEFGNVKVDEVDIGQIYRRSERHQMFGY